MRKKGKPYPKITLIAKSVTGAANRAAERGRRETVQEQARQAAAACARKREEETPARRCPVCGEALYDGDRLILDARTRIVLGCERCTKTRVV